MKLVIKDPKLAMKALGSNIERKAGTYVETADGMAYALAAKHPGAFEDLPKTKVPAKNKQLKPGSNTKTKGSEKLKSE